MMPMMTRLFGFVSMLAILAASGYALVGKARTGDVNPVRNISATEARVELASAQYTLAIVAGQLAQVKTVTGTFADTLDFDRFPLVRLVRADETSYCVEFEKTQTYFLAGPGGTVAQGSC
jgi:hypothetical protein